MNIRTALRKLMRKLGPPGNRGSLDTSYRQPNGDGGPYVGSGAPSGGGDAG